MNMNEIVVREFLERVWNKGDVDAIPKYFHESFRCDYGADAILSRSYKDMVDAVQTVRTAFPDFHEKVLQTIVDENRVVVHLNITGTQQGLYRGSPPTGKKFEVWSIDIFELSCGKITKQTGVMDFHGMFKQLGISN